MATEKELERMEELGAIEKVEDHRDWCAGMVAAPKSSGDWTVLIKREEEEFMVTQGRGNLSLAVAQQGVI